MAIASARVQVFIVPRARGARPISAGVVENVSLDKQYASEIHNSLGAGPGVDGTVNNETGMVSWGRVPKLNQAILDAIVPRIARWLEYEGVNLLLQDVKTGKGIALVIGIVPEQLGMQFTNGRAFRENFRGRCQYILLNEEVDQAGGQGLQEAA